LSNHLRLSQLLLRQLDRHPIRALADAEVNSFGEALAAFRQAGLLRYRRAADDFDSCSIAVAENGELVIEGETPSGQRWLDIDFRSVGVQARRAAGLVGPPLERLNDRIIHLGQLPGDTHRRVFYFVRLLNDANALDVALALKGRSSAALPIIVTPGTRELALDIGRRLELEGITVASAINLLDEEAPAPIALKLADVGLPKQVPPDALEIDEYARTAHFHRTTLDLEPRHFRMLVVLAREASTDGGIVPADDLLAAVAEGKDEDQQPQPEQVAVAASRIRKALRAAAGMQPDDKRELLKNDRKGGYALAIDKRKTLFV